MELDDFKQAWQAASPAAPAARLDGPRIRELLRRRSHSALAQLRRNIGLEVLTTVALVLPLGWYGWHQTDATLRLLVAATVVFCLGFAGALAYHYQRLGAAAPDPTLPLPEQLRRTVTLTANYVRAYERSLTWLTLGGLLLGGGMGGALQRHHPPPAPSPAPAAGPPWVSLLLLTAGLVATYALTIWIYRHWVRLLYGRHLDELRACLAELDEPAADDR